mgnify:CR=1 FL=1
MFSIALDVGEMLLRRAGDDVVPASSDFSPGNLVLGYSFYLEGWHC